MSDEKKLSEENRDKNDEKLKLLEEKPIESKDEENYCIFFPHEKVLTNLENIISKDVTIKNKTILLTGRWGTGKTSILNLLKKETPEKIYIGYDAWITTPDMLLREFLHEFFEKTGNSGLSEEINTVEKKANNILSIKILITAFFIYLGYRVVEKLVSFFLDSNIFCIIFISIVILIIIFYFKESLTKFIDKYKSSFANLLSKISYKSSHYTEFVECADITPRKMKKLLKEYKDKKEKNVVIIVDNLDRLSTDQQRVYIDALYTFNKTLKDVGIDICTIIAIDKTVFSEHKSIKLSYFDKISPYEVSLPELDYKTVNLYFKTILRENIPFIASSNNEDTSLYFLINVDRYLNSLIDVYSYFVKADYPKVITEKYPLAKDYGCLNTPRLIKKVYNQTVLLYNNWSELKINEALLFQVCFFVACSNVFNQEKHLQYIIEIIEDNKRSFNPLSQGKDKAEEVKIEKEKISRISSLLGAEQQRLLIITILSNKTFPTENEIFALCSKQSFSEYLEEYIDTFSLNAVELQENIRGALLKYKYPNSVQLGLDYITTLRIICEKNGKNFDIFTNNFANSLLKKIFNNDEYRNETYYLGVTIKTLMLLYINSSNKEEYQNKLYEVLEKFIENSIQPDYDNRGKSLFIILEYFNGHIQYFDEYEKLHDIVREYLIYLIGGKSYSFGNNEQGVGFSSQTMGIRDAFSVFRELSSELRSKIWKLIPKAKIGDYINELTHRAEDVNKKTDSEFKKNNEDLYRLLLELYIFRPDIHKSEELKSLFTSCYEYDSTNEFIKVLLLMEKHHSKKIFIDTENKLSTIQPDNESNYIFYLIYTTRHNFDSKFYKNLLEKIAEVILMKQHYDFSGAWITTPIYKYLYKNYKKDLTLILQDIKENYRETCYPGISVDSNEASELAKFIKGIINPELKHILL